MKCEDATAHLGCVKSHRGNACFYVLGTAESNPGKCCGDVFEIKALTIEKTRAIAQGGGKVVK